MSLVAKASPPTSPRFVRDDDKWSAVLDRNSCADGVFFYSVDTTGVYCRPSCPARRPRRENVGFHDSADDAERAGFRPCQRCHPREAPAAERRAGIVTQACRLIEAADDPLDLDTLASAVGMSRFHFHRMFKAATGLTPKTYARAHRARRVREGLERGTAITQVMYEAGFSSSGRFYSASEQMLGMTPSSFRDRGAGEQIRYAIGSCSLGMILVAASRRGVCAVLLGESSESLASDLRDRFANATWVDGGPDFTEWMAKVVRFVDTPGVSLDLPLDIRGTAFQQRVWQTLQQIPLGSTVSYTAVAETLGEPRSVRAVAQACAANPLAVIVPCHRVVRKDGHPSGYRWGADRKRRLLVREQALTTPGPNGGIETTKIASGHGSTNRLDDFDWPRIETELDERGWAMIPELIPSDLCMVLRASYEDDSLFRKRISMAAHGYGRGEYKYMSDPLPESVSTLRSGLYTKLVGLANRWSDAMAQDHYPAEHADFLDRCHRAGQTKPTPLLLRYERGDYNRMHQDLYGEHVFPIQVAILLSRPGDEFSGGEFVLSEQRPRMQAKVDIVPLRCGDAVAFAVRERPTRGARGIVRLRMRHGVSPLTAGTRYTLGIIFHDAE